MSKLFRATLVAKKSHPDSPESIIIHSDQFNTQKDFSDACIEELKQIEDVALWFAPKVERVTQEELDAASHPDITPQDCAADGIGDDSQIEDAGLINESVNAGSDISDTRAVIDQYHHFQYAKGYPIIIKLSKLDGKVRASYIFDSSRFLEIDKEFSTLENGLINALGYVIEDCIDAGIGCHEWAKLTVKGIGGRNPDLFFHESIMTPQEVIDFFDSEPETNLDTWEANDDIKYKKLYSRIVDVVSDYKGDQIPSASKCYVHLVSVIPEKHKGRYDIESRILREIAQVKNPHNFTNSTNSVQIMMMAFRDLDPADRLREVMQRLGEKLRDDEVVGEQKSGPESLPTTEEILPTELELIAEVVKNEPKNTESLPVEVEGLPVDDPMPKEKSDFEKQVEQYNEQIENLTPGELIIFDDMPNEVYHSCIGISSSKIKDAIKSLMYYNAKYNTNDIEVETGDQFDVGNVFHSITLEPDVTNKEYVCEPSGENIPEKPTAPQLEKYNQWIKDGRKENQNLKPADKVIAAVENWISEGKPENQNLKPADKVIAAVESHAADPENNKAPTDKQMADYKLWVDAGYPEPYKSKPTDKQIGDYFAWESAGKPEPYNDAPTELAIMRCDFWANFYNGIGNLYPVNADNWHLAENMAKSALSDSDSSRVLKHPKRQVERSYFKRCDITGMIIKARPDVELGIIIGDLKSIALRGNFDEKYLKTALYKEIINRNYHLSAAMYLDICGKDQFLWFFTNKQKGYHWTATLRASDGILEKGREIYFEYRQKIADAYQSGVWPKPESITSKFNPETNKIELPEV